MNIQRIKKWYLENGKLFFASIELTQKCNFKCLHCYCTDKNKDILSLSQYKMIIDKLYSTGCLFLHFTGGEILTNPYFEKIYCYAKDKGFVIDLLSNGSLITKEHVDLFREFPPNVIAITIYGTNRGEYASFTGDGNNYTRTMHSLKMLQDNHIPFVLRTVAAKQYLGSLMDGSFNRLALRYKTSYKYDPIIFPQTSGNPAPLKQCLAVDEIIALEDSNIKRREAWCDLIRSNKKFSWGCKGGVNSMAIDYKGDAHVCGLYRLKPISLLDNDMQTVVAHLSKVHKEHQQIVASNSCSQCKNRAICKWCPAYSNIYNGTDDKKIDFFCQLSVARIKCFG